VSEPEQRESELTEADIADLAAVVEEAIQNWTLDRGGNERDALRIMEMLYHANITDAEAEGTQK
jgi:hypothetical protein